MQEEKKTINSPQNCILENRKKLSVSGVTEVISFDEEAVNLRTSLGALTVKGEHLHITGLSLEIGEASVEGTVNSFYYTDNSPQNTSFFSKVFR